MRLGGDFYKPGHEGPHVWTARRLFLEQVCAVAPQVLTALKDRVLPVYKKSPFVTAAWRDPDARLEVMDAARTADQQSWEILKNLPGNSKKRFSGIADRAERWDLTVKGRRTNYGDSIFAQGYLLRWRWAHHLAAKDAKFRRLESELLAWSAEWGLGDPWALDYALWTLDSWQVFPNTLDSLCWRAPPVTSTQLWVPEDERPTFTPPWWDPYNESWESYREQFDKAARRFRATCKDFYEGLVRKHGGKRASQKRDRSGNPHAHFLWLAQRQVLGLSIEDIAEEFTVNLPVEQEPPDIDAIKKAITRTAKRIRLTLRT